VVRDQVGGICIRIKVKGVTPVKVMDKISIRDRDTDRDKVGMVVKDTIRTKVKVNTAIKDIRTKINTRTKVIEDKTKAIMAIPDHTTRINIILDIMLVQVNFHLRSLLRGIILRMSFSSFLPSPPFGTSLAWRSLIISGAGYNPGNTQQQYQGSQNLHQADGREQGQVKQYFEYSTCTSSSCLAYLDSSPCRPSLSLHLLGRIRMEELMNRSRKSKSPARKCIPDRSTIGDECSLTIDWDQLLWSKRRIGWMY
jgi:hypothetical protein